LSDREGFDFEQLKSIAKVQVGLAFHVLEAVKDGSFVLCMT
jgi:hypothetical protein